MLDFLKAHKEGARRKSISWCILPKTDPTSRQTYWLEEVVVEEVYRVYTDSKYGEQEQWVTVSVVPVDKTPGSFQFT